MRKDFASVFGAAVAFLFKNLLLRLKYLNCLQKPKRNGALGSDANLGAGRKAGGGGGGGWSGTRPFRPLACKRPGAKSVTAFAVFRRLPRSGPILVATGLILSVTTNSSPNLPPSGRSSSQPHLGLRLRLHLRGVQGLEGSHRGDKVLFPLSGKGGVMIPTSLGSYKDQIQSISCVLKHKH